MASTDVAVSTTGDTLRERAVSEYRRKVAEHREVEGRLKESKIKINSTLCKFLSYHFLLLHEFKMTIDSFVQQ